MSREQQISRSELIRRCRQVAISISLALTIAACGGGGGGGGQPSAPVQQNPPPAANVAPSVEAGAAQTIQWPTATAQLNGTATDDASQTLTYTWTATSGPSGVTFGTPNAAATTVTFPSEGDYVLTLSVSDGSATGTDTVNVTVSPASEPPPEAPVYPASDAANDDPDNHGWARVASAAEVGMDQALLDQAMTYAQTSGTANPADNAGMIVRHGRIVSSWGQIDRRYDMKSTTKSIGGMSLGLAMANGLLLSDRAETKLPTIGARPAANATTGWLGNITIEQLATHTAGFLKDDDLTEAPEPAAATLVNEPGTTWLYSDIGLNWLAEVLTAVLGDDLSAVLNRSVWTTLGVNSTSGSAGGGATSDVHWRNNEYRDQTNKVPYNRELASGMFVNANAMARVGLLFLRKGVWANDQRILPETFVTTVSTPVAANANLPNPGIADFPGAPTDYGVLWWTNAGGQLANVPRDAYWAWGLGDSLIVVIPSLDIVVVRAGAQAAPASSPQGRVWNDDDWNGDYTVLAPFLDPIVKSVSK
ncbi:serine hydrolase domain-containing protein [Peristeroidobacter agariperforans]|uniref:serine hydrolase domain-containing protein n=1 Tax=Peristeroidobacter agariperforans TaxID=268404 RepID=UPI001300939C|nr:serine hydrolase [Peristeroidobacter agariperforans]